MNFLRSRVTRLQLASWLLILESSIVISLCFFLIYKSQTAENTSDRKALTGEIIFYTIGAILIFLMGIGIKRDRAITKAPSILTNLIAVGISWYMFSAGLILAAIGLALTGIAVVLLVGSTVKP